MKKILALLALLVANLGSAHATATFTDVTYTADSISFIASGNLEGYAAPSSLSQVSIVYTGNIFNYSADTPNYFIGSLFSNTSGLFGNSGGFGTPNDYTWIGFTPVDAVKFSGSAFTVTWDQAILNTAGTGQIQFFWGNATQLPRTLMSSFTVLDGVVSQTSAVPEPGTYLMLLMGLGMITLLVRRKTGSRLG